MAGITLADAQAQLAAWLAASTAVATGQSYTIEGRSLTRADLDAINRSIDKWDQRVQALSLRSSGRGRSRVPRPVF